MEAQLGALALEELALHAFPGISFERLCATLEDEHQIHFDPFVKRLLWRSLYRSHDAFFTPASAYTVDFGGADSEGAPAAGGPAEDRAAPCLPWRNPQIPPDLPVVVPRTPSVEDSTRAAEEEPHTAAPRSLPAASPQEKCWLVSTSAGVPLRLLMPMDFSSDRRDFERRVAEVPFRVLRNIARHKEHGQWQYRIAQELSLEPKSVFHHLKPLYRDELICHMQLAIPPGHKTLDRSSSRGSVSQLLGREGSRMNLTMSALLWSSRFFSPLRLPADVKGLMTLHHLLPLQQQAVELLRSAPNHILLEEEVRHFCTSKLLNSDQAPYLRFSDKQVRRLFHRLREALERTGKVRRVRAFCKQTVRYERCLLYMPVEEALVKTKEQPTMQTGEAKAEQDTGGNMITQVKVEEGTLAATAASAALPGTSTPPPSSGWQTAEGGEENDDSSSVVLEVEGASLSSVASLLLKAAGPEGVTTVELAHLLGLDNKRSGKILAEFYRRNLVTRVAERRGKCFLYRYISKEVSHLKALLAEAAAVADDSEAAGADTSGAPPTDVCPAPPAEACPPLGAVAAIEDCSPFASVERAVPSSSNVTAENVTSPPVEGECTPSTVADGTARAKQEPEDDPPASHVPRPVATRRRPHVAASFAAVEDASGSSGTRKRALRAEASRGSFKKRSCPRQQTQTPTSAGEDEQQPAADGTTEAATPESAIGDAAAAQALADASDEGGNGIFGPVGKQAEETEGDHQRGLSESFKELKAQAGSRKLPFRTLRLLDTPQFAARLALFQDTIRSAGCSTIPNISKAIADMEQTANGPDRKTVQRMADVAMQLEPRIRRGRLVPSKTSADRLEEPLAPQATAGEITFFYWTEMHDEASAEQRIAALVGLSHITQRRAQGCRDAIRRNQLLLDGKLKEAGEELRISGNPSPTTPSQIADQPASSTPAGETPIDSARPSEEAGTVTLSGSAGGGSCFKNELFDQQLKGLESEISRLANLESRSSSNSVLQPCPGTTAASLLMVEKTLPLASLHDKVSFSQKHLSFYGFIFPVMVRAKCFHQYLLSLTLQLEASEASSPTANNDCRRLAVSTMIRRMPLESFLRLVGCGYALPMLDEHLAKDSASRQPMHKLPGPLFRLLVFSSRQIQCYRQLHPKAKMPLLGLGKKNAGTAVRKLLSLLGRMGIVSRIDTAASPTAEEAQPQRSPVPPATWKLNDTLKLPAFSTTGAPDGGGSPEVKEFDGLSHEGVEAFWQQLQLQVSQWMMREQQINWTFDGEAEPSQFFSPHFDMSDGVNASDKEGAGGSRAPDVFGTATRRRPQPPKDFPVPEAFNSKNWKGQVAFTGSARAAMDAFAAETLEKLRDAGGAELEAVVLNASSPQIAELSARVGYPTDAVLRYLIRVFEIKGGSERNHALLVRGWKGDERAASPVSSLPPNQSPTGVGEEASVVTASLNADEGTGQELRNAKVEAKERDRGVGLIVHRTREVRFQCHHCGHFYSWEKSIRLHYDKVHREALPSDETLYVLPWERKRRQEDRQQKAELSKFKRRRRTIVPSRDYVEAEADQLVVNADREGIRASERFISRLPVRGTVKSVEAPASGFLLRATHDQEAVLASMSREDEITLIGAAIVAERLWQAAHTATKQSTASSVLTEKSEIRNGPLTDAWLSPGTPQSLPPEDHLIWQILGRLCRPPLAPANARLYVGFVLNRRALNSRIYSSFRRLEPSALRHFVLEGRIPTALEIRVHCVPREEGAGPRRSLVCRPLNNPRILMARNILKAVVFTPLPFYRPAVLFGALRELRPLELNALWRSWQRRGWVTAFKPTSVAPGREKKEPISAESAARQPQPYKKPEIAAVLESKCRRPFVLSSGSRLSLFGRLRDYRSLSALLHATLALTARSASEASPPSAEAASTAPVAENSLTEEKLEANGLPTETCEHQGASDTTHDLLFSNLAQELHSSDTGRSGEADLTNDADIHLLQLLDGDRTDSASPNLLAPSAGVQQLSISHAGNSLSLGETSQASSRIGKSVAVVGRVKLSVDSEVSGYEVLAALEGLGRGKLWLSPFWGTDGRLPDPPEAADDAELLNLLEEEDSLDPRAAGGGIWNDVPEWLSAISLGRGEEGGDLVPGRPLRRPTEGGIETHITAHAAGVAEITAVTCAVLGDPVTYLEKQTTGENLPVHASTCDSNEEEDFPYAEVSSICKELEAAFECSESVSVAPVKMPKGECQTRGGTETSSSGSVVVAPASHLSDGLFGAAGEFDAFDASLLPPIITDRTACAAVSFLKKAETYNDLTTEDSESTLLGPGLHSGFPVSLPTYADDHKQHWRLTARTAEAFAPPDCSCCASCGCAVSWEPPTDNTNPGIAATVQQEDPPSRPCIPVPPLRAFAREEHSSRSPINTSPEASILASGPTEILVRYLKSIHAGEVSASQGSTCGPDRHADWPSADTCRLPDQLLQAIEETTLFALATQRHFLLPLLTTPPLPLAASRLHVKASEELTLIRSGAASAATLDASRKSASTRAVPEEERSAERDMSVCIAFTLCTAWILQAVLTAKAEGVAVPDLLVDLSTEANTTAEADLHDAARLSFAYAACELAKVVDREEQPHNGKKVHSAKWATSGATGAPSFNEWAGNVRHDNSYSTAAFACQLFLVSTSLLCRLRLVVPVPAGSCWRLVSAAEAALRFCLKEQRVLRDSVAARWASHAGDSPEQLESTPAATSSDDCFGNKRVERMERPSESFSDALPPPPAMVPRAIWATWGPSTNCGLRTTGRQQLISSSDACAGLLGCSEREGTTHTLHSANDRSMDTDQQAIGVCGFLSAMLTWEGTKQGTRPLNMRASHRDEASAARQSSTIEPMAAPRNHLLPMRLSPDILPACAWMRLDGRLHASLVQLICLRLWSLLMQRPGSTAQQLQGMLCVLDDCEVQLLLHALAEEGIITAAVLSEMPSMVQAQGTDSTEIQSLVPRALSGGNTQRNCSAPVEDDKTADAFTLNAAFHSAQFASSVTDYALRVQTIYLPNAVADVLPEFQPLLLPKLAACCCGCAVFL